MARRRKIESTSRVATAAAIAVAAKTVSAQSQASLMTLACSAKTARWSRAVADPAQSSVSDPAQRPFERGTLRTDLACYRDLLAAALLGAPTEIDAFFEHRLMVAAGGAETPAAAGEAQQDRRAILHQG